MNNSAANHNGNSLAHVTELGYIGIGVKDPDAWKQFATEVAGMEFADEGERDRCYLRMDYWHHRIVMHRDDCDDLMYLGFRVADAEAFAQMQHKLEQAGVKFRVASNEEADERRVLELVKLEDPEGTQVEIFHGPLVQFKKPFRPGRGMHGRFKTGEGGIGHCILRQRDANAALGFYRQLGLHGGIEYKVPMGKQTLPIYFMRCNERQHTVAFGVPTAGRINHLMIEVDNLDDVGLAYDLVRARKIPVTISPGKHSNDQMFSFYFRNPSGWIWEYGWGGRPSPAQTELYQGDIYGHQFEAGGFDTKVEL